MNLHGPDVQIVQMYAQSVGASHGPPSVRTVAGDGLKPAGEIEGGQEVRRREGRRRS